MIFGGQTITFIHLEKSGTPDELGHYTMVPVSHDAPFSRHRPLSFKEAVELQFDIATEFWRSTLPVHLYTDPVRAAVLGATAEDVIEVDGQEYQIVGGVRTHPDAAGLPFKTTIISQKQIG